MTQVRKTPGVYVTELDAFGNSVVAVPTAVPVFIGYTAQTSFNGQNLKNKAIRISSLTEYLSYYGSKPPQTTFTVAKIDPKATPQPEPDFTVNGDGYTVDTKTVNYRLHGSIKLFFENGGGHCYVISVGTYDYTLSTLDSNTDDFAAALKILEKEPEPTMIVIPDAVEMINTTETDIDKKYANCYQLQNQMLNHCGTSLNRVAILDVAEGYKEQPVGTTSCIEAFRNSVEPTLSKFNSYGAAYYPWLNTTVFQLTEVSSNNIDKGSQATVTDLIKGDFNENQLKKVQPYIDALFAAGTAQSANDNASSGTPPANDSGGTQPTTPQITPEKADAALSNLSKSYQLLMNNVVTKLNLMPPSAAMAGIYTTVDNNEGVWIAPANVAVQSVISPAITIDSDTQEDLNVPIDGKSISAIRAFTGRGVLVWGARTLDGNSNDWRYINVRRTLIYIEQSIKDAAAAYVFAPNTPSTWIDVSSLISNFLTGLWKQGGLVGSKPEDAFSVTVGLGSTMTGDDILNGYMRVAVKVAVSHPAEFIDITFQQQMQA